MKDPDVGYTVKTVDTGAVTGLWWRRTADLDTCVHPPEGVMFTRIWHPSTQFYQEFCGACGAVLREEGARPETA